ncbi:response regulator transcription factor [Nitratiruptor sp. YY09-18]|uniref:response regulator transcription factor n=1 Tax=Nitratiruptor sp. YY09-18 TaxID=2724901 RepID=UPI001915FCE0|nr:response regulator transcription factor [Nitratiruptor sp. YY09-18]BCD67475.1 hypothetical protein NitYY0918_C0368 [Nitratiruptor sp. YY09-18]
MKLLLLAQSNLAQLDIKYDHVVDIEGLEQKSFIQKYDLLLADFAFFGTISQYKNLFSYIILLTNMCDEQSYARALQIADDCILWQESKKIEARISYYQKKLYNLQNAIFSYRDLRFDVKRGELFKGRDHIALSNAQKELLLLLLKNMGSYVQKHTILQECDSINSENSIKVLIAKLRGLGFTIESQPSQGYKIVKEKR